MGDKGKPWRKQRSTPMGFRRGRTAAVDAFRSVASLDIPHATGGERTRDIQRQCSRKKGFASETHARRVAGSGLVHGVVLRAYPCPHCGQWHVGGL